MELSWGLFKTRFNDGRVCYSETDLGYIVFFNVNGYVFFSRIESEEDILDFESNYKSIFTNVYNVINDFIVVNFLWDKSNNDIYYNKGKVGIQCNNPDVELDLNGCLRLRQKEEGDEKNGVLWYDGLNLKFYNNGWKILGGGLKFKGVWNAQDNIPFLDNENGENGDFYIVNVAGNVNVNGYNDWEINDWIIKGDVGWYKIDNTDKVVSVNNKIGNVVLNKDDIGLGNVLNEEQITINNGSINQKFLSKNYVNDDDILLIEDSNDSFKKKKIKILDFRKKKYYAVDNVLKFTNSTTRVLLLSLDIPKSGLYKVSVSFLFRKDNIRSGTFDIFDGFNNVLNSYTITNRFSNFTYYCYDNVLNLQNNDKIMLYYYVASSGYLEVNNICIIVEEI